MEQRHRGGEGERAERVPKVRFDGGVLVKKFNPPRGTSEWEDWSDTAEVNINELC
ncbi:MAG: hypothetical protein ACTS4T_00685 [Candidatus Hodgkinia cicadicola]